MVGGVLARALRPGARALVCGAVVVAVAVGGTVAWTSASSGVPQAVDPSQVETFVGTTPTRVLDTRQPAPNPFAPGETRVVTLAGRVDARVTSVVINITLDADATEQSFLTVWPTGESRPLASANNAQPGIVSPNQMVAKLGTNQSFSIFNERGRTNVIIDVVGVLVPLDEVALGAGSGSSVLTGSGAPAAALGQIGDVYVDVAGKALYGPKSSTGWGAPSSLQGSAGPAGPPGPAGPVGPAGPSGAIAYAYGGTGVLPTLSLGTPNLLDFNANLDIAVGSSLTGPVDKSPGGDGDSDPDTFTAVSGGVYEVSYSIPVASLGAAGSAELRINGATAGPTLTLAAIGTASRTQLVALSAGDELQLWLTPPVGMTLSGAHTITIKQLA